MGALEEVLIDLVLHKSIQGISYLFSLRILEFHLWLDFEILRLVILLVSFALLGQKVTTCIPFAKCALVLRHGTRTTIWVISVVKFV